MEIQDKMIKLSQHATHEEVHNMLLTAMAHLHSINPRVADELADTFDGNLNYSNFLTESEAQRIVNDFLNEDGSHGAIWSAKDFFAKAESLGIELEHAPLYNRWALYTATCMMISDHMSVISKWTNNDVTKYVEMACDLAKSQLNDRDKPNWIRWYFNMK